MIIFRQAKENELIECTNILKSSFDGYSFFEIFVNNKVRRKKFFNAVMDVWIKISFKNELVLVAELNKEIVGVSVISTPSSKQATLLDYMLSGGLKVVLAGGIRNTINFIKMAEKSDKVCNSLPGPKWHLSLFAISNNHKGKGLGSKLLKHHILPLAKKNGCKLFTFNTNEEYTRNFYIKNGFNEFHETVLYENGKTIGNWSYKLEL